MTDAASETGPFVVEVPSPGSAPSVPDPNRFGHLKHLWDEGEWSPVHFCDSDIGWQLASETPPCAPTPFDTKQEAEAKLRQVLHRQEVLAAATHTAVSPFFRQARVAPATALQIKTDFAAEVEIERRAAKLGLLREQEEQARARREAEENELAQIRADAKADLERLRQEAGGTDWGALGGQPKIQSRRRRDGSECFRARVSGNVSPTYGSVDEAIQWRDEHEHVPSPASPPLVGRAEGSRPA